MTQTTDKPIVPSGRVLRRLAPPLFALMVLFTIGAGALFLLLEDRRINENFTLQQATVQREFQVDIANQARGLSAVTKVLAFDPAVQTALAQRDADRLSARFKPVFDHLFQENQVTHFKFLGTDRICFLRLHSPAVHGDRDGWHTTLQAERTGKLAWGIELGQTGNFKPLPTFTLRVVQPVFQDGQPAGFVMIGKEIDDIWRHTSSRFGGKSAILAKKEGIDRQWWEANMERLGLKADWDRLPDALPIHNWSGFSAEDIATLAGRAVHDPLFSSADQTLRMGESDWKVQATPLVDASGKEAGILLLMLDITAEKAEFNDLMVWVFSTGGAALTILLGSIFLMLFRTDKRIQAQNAREAHLKQVLLAIRNVNQLITMETDPARLTKRACETLTETMGYDLAWIALTDETADRTVMTASAGVDRGFETLEERLDRGEFPRCMQQALAQDKVVVIEDPDTQCPDCPLADSYAGQPRLIRRMECKGRIYGVVTVCVHGPYAHDAEGQGLFNELVGDLAFGLNRIENDREIIKRGQLLAAAEQIAHLGSWELDLATGRLTWSDETYRILGFEPQQFQSTYESFLEVVHVEDRAAVDAVYTASVREKKDGYEIEHRVVRQSTGEIRYVHERCRHIKDTEGRIVRSLGSVHDITERKQIEAALARQAMVEKLVAEVSLKLLGTGSFEEISHAVLEKARQLTGSPFGFVGHMDPQTGTFVSSTLTRDIWEGCRVADKTVVFERFTGLWGWVLNNRRPLVSNHPESDHRSSGVPEGHIPIGRFMGVPALHGEELVGMIALANSEDDYSDEDLAFIERLSIMYSLSIQKARAEEELNRINDELTDSKSNLEAILSAVPVGILVFNQDAQIVSDNPAARAICGIEEFNPGSLRCRDYIGCCRRHNQPEGCGSTADCPDCEINDAIANVLTGEVDSTEDREKEILRDTKVPKSLWIQFSTSPVVLQGQMCAVLVFRDISRQKQMGEELERTENLLISSQRFGKIGGWEWDIGKQSMLWTDETYRIHGFTPDELEPGSPEHIARSLACYAPDARELVQKAFERCVSTGEPYELEVSFTNTAGRPMWVRTTGQAVWEGDRKVKASGIIMDITERRAVEIAMQASEARLRYILSASPVVIFAIRPEDFAATWVSPNVSALIGYTAEEALKPGWWVEYLHPEDREQALANTARVLETGHIGHEYRFFRKDGTVCWVYDRMDLLTTGDGTEEIIGAWSDITERKRAENELKKVNSELQAVTEKALAFANKAEAANRAKSLFLSNMSHELRTPLNAVIGFSQLLARDPLLTERQRSDVQVVLRSGQDLLNIINEILEISRIEAGRLEIKPVDFSIHELLTDLEQMFRSRSEAKGLRLVVERGGDLPEFLYGDSAKIKQVLLNLLSNAVKFTENGGISLRVRGDVCEEESLEQRDMVRLTIEVEDSGIGISEENLEKIFKPFEQVESTVQEGGSGLGLAISREYAVLLGGEIRVASEPGRGSCFRFTALMPRGKATPGNGLTVPRNVVGLEPDTGPVRVLVVDDNADNQVLLKALLAPIGVEIRQAHNGREALMLFEEFSPHAVLMDMRMPDMDGYEATRRIKNTDKGLATPVIALTASAFEEGKRRIFDAGVDAYLRKPFQHWEVYEILGRCLGLRYVYNEENDLKPLAPTVEAVFELPEELRAKLRQAVEEGDMDLFTELLEQATESHPELVKKLRKLADVFDYRKLFTLLMAP
ncbi:MAG: PAS domain-containing protein [Pseudomonadota bacterium]